MFIIPEITPYTQTMTINIYSAGVGKKEFILKKTINPNIIFINPPKNSVVIRKG